MILPKLGDSFDNEQSVCDGSEISIADYLETIALLQEEVERLEKELHSHAARQNETPSNDGASLANETEAAGTEEHGAGEPEGIERFQAELASRDETIRLLLDELNRVEQAQAATRAEWEHLAGWVTELEQRVEGQDHDALHQLENRLAAKEQEAEALRVKSERDRRAWKAKRQIDQQEIARLQGLLDQVVIAPEDADAPDGPVTQIAGFDSNVIEALQAENSRLRAACQEQVERAAVADRADALEAKLAEMLNERQQLRRQIEQIQDERKREQLEYGATVADLQSRLSQASLTPAPGPPPEKRPGGDASRLEIDLHVRTLRQHLIEIDQREKEERNQKHLINRLSRIWSRTGPR